MFPAMNAGLKALIAITCIVVIATAGLWLWRTTEADAVAVEARELRAACDRERQNLERGVPAAVEIIRNCMDAGYISGPTARDLGGNDLINAVNALRASQP